MQQFYSSQSDKLDPPDYIFLTAFTTPIFKKYAEKTGAVHCFEKPLSKVDSEQLRDTL